MTTISRWGNSLGLRIPEAAMQEADLAEGDRVRVSVEEGRLTIDKMQRLDIEELVARITPENRHGALETTMIGIEVR